MVFYDARLVVLAKACYIGSHMEYTIRRVFSTLAVFSLVLGLFSPFAAEAATKKKVVKKQAAHVSIAMNLYNPKKRYGDEKIEIVNPTTRCLTAAAKKAHLKDLQALEADGKKINGLDEPGHALADDYKKYETALEYAWGAMEEPYCGFGAFGSSAALKSYQKTVLRARTTWLDAVKKNK